jgi:DNA-binding transcriptional ArsR family regulator
MGGKKLTKVPVDPRNPNGPPVSVTDPNNWMPYEVAKRCYETCTDLSGYGFARREEDPYAFIDIDERIDPETGELPPVAVRLIESLDSYSYLTPNYGVRIVLKGELSGTGGKYAWVDPDTGEEHVFEVYDRKGYVTFTDRVVHDVPVREAQGFLDSLVKTRRSNTGRRRTKGVQRQAQALPEGELPEDLEASRREIKRLFLKHDLDPYPILAGSRKNTLISHFRTIVRNTPIEISEEFDPNTSPDELWKLLTCANATMLYDEEGQSLERLDEGELEEVYRVVTNLPEDVPDKSPREVQEKLDELEGFLGAVMVRLNYRLNSAWKVLKALQEHGRKYGRLLSEDDLRVDIAWLTLMKQARISSKETLSKALKKLEERGIIITRGWHEGDESGHFVIDLQKAMAPPSWGIEADVFYAQSYQSDGNVSRFGTTVHKEKVEREEAQRRGGIEDKERQGILEALTYTTWYRKVGPSKLKYIRAIIRLGGEATSTEIAESVGVKPSSVSRPLKALKDDGIIRQDKPRGPYRTDETVAEDLYRYRLEKGEFLEDKVAKTRTQTIRASYKYQKKLENVTLKLLREGKAPEAALMKAKELVSPPRGFDEYELAKPQERALRWAERSNRKERKSGGDEPAEEKDDLKDTVQDARRDESIKLRREMRESYFTADDLSDEGGDW